MIKSVPLSCDSQRTNLQTEKLCTLARRREKEQECGAQHNKFATYETQCAPVLSPESSSQRHVSLHVRISALSTKKFRSTLYSTSFCAASSAKAAPYHATNVCALAEGVLDSPPARRTGAQPRKQQPEARLPARPHKRVQHKNISIKPALNKLLCSQQRQGSSLSRDKRLCAC